MASLADTASTAALVSAVAQIETALPAVSPTSDTPDMQIYGVLLNSLQLLVSNLTAVISIQNSEAANAAQPAGDTPTQ